VALRLDEDTAAVQPSERIPARAPTRPELAQLRSEMPRTDNFQELLTLIFRISAVPLKVEQVQLDTGLGARELVAEVGKTL
jgi:hypothetical protein